MFKFQSLRKSQLANFFRSYWHILRPPVWPGQCPPLLRRISRYNIDTPKKLLHIGANIGNEANYYAQNDIEAWHIEAIPDVYQQLVEQCARTKSQHPVLACLSSTSGEQVAFNIASNFGQSSSLFGLGRHAEAYPSIYYEKTIRLTTTTVDNLIAEGVIPPDIDYLVIDVQGAELLVLQGARGLLSSGCLKGASIETSCEILYDGGATYIEVSSEMKSHGLYLCEAAFCLEGWCEALYAKKYWS